MPIETLRKNLIYLRRSNKLTQNQMDIIQNNNSKLCDAIEHSKCNIQLDSLKRVSDYFKVSIDDLCTVDISTFSKRSLEDFYQSAQLSLKSKND